MEKPVVTVTELNTLIKDFIENLPPVKKISVKGEISNITLHRTGHIYMTLKDESSLIKAVMFKYDADKLTFVPKNGDKVIADGRVSVFVRDGVYQLYVESMEPDGVGSLFQQFEELKAKLEKEGLFDASRKRPLPSVPFSVGIVTAPTGAAIRDMINISGRRFPSAEIVLYPSLVQGADAARNIIRGIEWFNTEKRVEVIVIGRGGGSIEDLWAFNDERLARVIAQSRIPVISAVGHETDFTIADFAADMRAPTPSAAMELALPDRTELLRKFGNVKTRISKLLSIKLESEKRLLGMLGASSVFTNPSRMFSTKILETERFSEKIVSTTEKRLNEEKRKIESLSALLMSYNPLGVLKRGYSVAYDGKGKIVTSVNDVASGDTVTVEVSDGSIKTVVK